MKNYIAVILFFSLFANCFAQKATQNIRGVIYDKDSKQTLIGATVMVLGLDETKGTITDFDGSFLIEDVPVGRRQIECSYVGYSSYQSDFFILNSAKEYVIDVELIETGITTEEVVVKAYKNGNEATNELAVLSSRSFSVEETQRYAASANDPGRMAQAFPGVQPARDTRSDIIIRGNSSVGLLWRLEGVDIPNPNHFARRGSSGGGITIFSTSMLGKSDFFTGAFPAEYGNAFSGVFDVKFRKGNRENREYTFKAGILGLDFSTEGPIKKGRSSYLVNYRYSTLGILNSMGIHLVSERVDNTFQDLSFNLNFPSANNKSIFGIWGIGGLSSEMQSVVEDPEDWKTISDRATYDFTTNMGAMGVNHTYLIDDKSYVKTTLAGMAQQVVYSDDILNDREAAININTEDYTNSRLSLSTFYNRKINPYLGFKTGVYLSDLIYNLQQDSLNINTTSYQSIINTKGNTFLIQPFAQFKYRPTPKLSVNFGVHAMFLTLNNTSSIEPRLGLQYQLSEKQSISAAYGLHGRILPLGSYFTEVGEETPNMDLEMIKSHHVVLAYKVGLTPNINLQVEAYFQSLFDVPVVNDLERNYWLLNDVQGYATEALVSEGTGTNVGLDVSLEKYFSNNTYFILNGSIYDSKYSALDKNKTFNTQYNSNYSASLMAGKEWNVGKSAILQTGLKLIYNGGLRITPLLENASSIDGFQAPEDESRSFSEQIPNYFRPDMRIAYRKDKQKYAWSLALDVQNFIGRRNIDGLNRTYDSDLSQWVYREQSSLVPVISYQIDF